MDASLHTTQRWAQLLPDGEHVLLFAGLHEKLDAETNGIWVARRDGSEMRQLLRADSGGVYADGYLLYVRESSLMAQRFDIETNELTGTPVPLGESVSVDATTWGATFTATDDGTLIYLPADQPMGRLLRWVARDGTALETWQPAGNYQTVRLAPGDRGLVAEFQQTPVSQLYLYDMSGRSEQISFGTLDFAAPVWNDDGASLFVTHSAGDNTYALFTMPFRGGSATPLFALEGSDVWGYDVSAEQGILLAGTGQYFSRGVRTALWAVPLDGSEPYALPKKQGWTVAEAALSHDGRSIAITGLIAGNSEPQVYVAPLVRVDGRLQPGEPRRQVSQNGGYQPRWRGDDAEIFFLQGSGVMTAAALDRGERGEVLRSGAPEVLFSASLTGGGGVGYGYDVTEDGERFVILETDSRGRQLALVSDWRRALRSAER